jgi:hypothetical protein
MADRTLLMSYSLHAKRKKVATLVGMISGFLTACSAYELLHLANNPTSRVIDALGLISGLSLVIAFSVEYYQFRSFEKKIQNDSVSNRTFVSERD